MLPLMMLGFCQFAPIEAYLSRVEPPSSLEASAAATPAEPEQAAWIDPRIGVDPFELLMQGPPAPAQEAAAEEDAPDFSLAARGLHEPAAPAIGLADDQLTALTRLPRFDLPTVAPAIELAAAPEPAPQPTVAVAAPEREIRRASDGLFYVDALVNGVPIRFLVDTGASVVVLSPGDAARAGFPPQLVSFDASAETAGGQARMARVTLDDVVVADTHVRAIEAAVVRQDLAVSLLGQSWLAKLGSITIAGDRMMIN